MFKNIIALCVLILIPLQYALGDNLNNLHDPTRPANALTPIKKSAGNLKVDAIFLGKEKNTVIIGGQALTIGDIIMGAKIVAIKPDCLILADNKGEFTVKTTQIDIKSPSKK